MEAQGLQSFIPYDAEHHFPLENIPFGVYKTAEGNHCCTRIGDKLIDLAALFAKFDGPHFKTLKENIFDKPTLNDFAGLGKEFRIEARETI
jgi:fumarylacetoacetase